MKFSDCKRLARYLKRHWFTLVYRGSFYRYGARVSIIDPDIIEGAQYISLEDGVSFNTGVWMLALQATERVPAIHIKQGTVIGRFAHIVAVGKIVIEENVLIADKVYIADNMHAYENISLPVRVQDIIYRGSVVIGKNSWIGENVSIIGARIGKHCIIGSNAVVNKDIPDYSVAVGVPAKIVKRYNTKSKTWEKTNEQGVFLDEI